MAKISITQFKKKILDELAYLNSKEFLHILGEQAIDAIKTRTRAGYGVTESSNYSGTSRQRLKELAKSTKEQRARLKDQGKLDGRTTPNFSNLTRSGQLLDSMKILELKRKSVVIGPSGRRNGESLTNQDLAEYVAEQGRPFNKLVTGEVRKVVNIVEREIVRIARSLT